jgi:hypothetical protein
LALNDAHETGNEFGFVEPVATHVIRPNSAAS